MKNLEMWYNWLQADRERLKSADIDDPGRAEIQSHLRLLYEAMKDNKPRKSRNRDFKLFIYTNLLSEVERTLYGFCRKKSVQNIVE